MVRELLTYFLLPIDTALFTFTKIKNMKKIKQIIALSLFPVLFLIFIFDRFIVSPFWWFRMKSLREWTNDGEGRAYSVVRVLVLSVIYILVKIFS